MHEEEAPVDEGAKCRLTLMGRPHVTACTGEIRVLLPRQAALLLFVLMDGPIARSEVSARLWPGKDPRKQQDSLRTLIKSVNERAGCRVFNPAGEALSLLAAVEHDVGALFGQPVQAGVPNGGELLHGTDAALPGDLLPWLEEARHRLRQKLHAARRDQCDRDASSESAAALLPHAEQLVHAQPDDELSWRLLIRLHYLRGHPDAALRAVRECRKALLDCGRQPPSEAIRQLTTLIEQNLPLPQTGVDRKPVPLAPARTVGRDGDRVQILRALDQGRLVWLSGESGFGKTQLLGAIAHEQAPSAVVCRAALAEAEQPYAMVARLLTALLDHSAPQPMPMLAPEVRGELARLVSAFGQRSPAPAQTWRLKQALFAALRAWCDHGVAVVLLDDMQWADATSTDLLLEAAQAATGLRWIFSARSARPASGGPAAAPSAPDQADWLFVHQLNPLDEDALADLIRALPVSASDPAEWGRALWPHCLGVPMNAIEALLALRVAHGGGVFRGRPPPYPWPIDTDLPGLLARRLRSLPEQELQLAQLVALSDDDCDPKFLCHLMKDITSMELNAIWTRLCQAAVLDARGLRHESLRQPLLARLAAPVAQDLRWKFAEHAAMTGAAAASVALRWEAAKAWPEAARAFEQAAIEAGALDAPAQQARLLESAACAHERAGAVEAAFDCRVRAYEMEIDALPPDQVLARVTDLERRATNDAQRVAAGWARAHLAMSTFEFDTALQAAEGALLLADALVQFDPSVQPRRVQLLQLRCQALAAERKGPEALALLKQIEEEIADGEDKRVRLAQAAATSYVHHHLSQFEPARLACSGALDLARELGDTKECLSIGSNLGILESIAGDFRLAREVLLDVQEWREQLGAVNGAAALNSWLALGVANIRLGRYKDALHLLTACLAHARRSGSPVMQVQCENQLAGLWLDLGSVQRARAVLTPLPDLQAYSNLSRVLVEALLDRRMGLPAGERLLALQPIAATASVGVQLELKLSLSLEEPPERASAMCLEVARDAANQSRQALAQAALLSRAQALRCAGRSEDAAQTMREILKTLDRCAPSGTYIASVWWEAWQAFSTVGASDEADASLSAGHRWIRETLRAGRVPEELKESFLKDNVVNASLLQAASAHGMD